MLASKADTPDHGTRYEADGVWFHVDQDSRFDTWPSGYEFVAPAGSTVWLAPEVQQQDQIWPGFSTESVPAGTLDNDDTTLTLVGVDGPGDVELWNSGTFGEPNRLWSSDEAAYKSFTRKRVHMHSNWAFTEPGTYELTVRADAVVDGEPVSDTAVYTFVVGDLPEDRDTTTMVSASESELTAGEPVTLRAEVAPADVDGYVEFFRGENSLLGHAKVEDGAAELEVDDLAPGTHRLWAQFVPAVQNVANLSSSDPVTVTVTDESGVPFSITGIKDAYQPGDTLAAQVVGASLGEDEEFRWLWRYQGDAGDGTIVPQTGGRTTYSQVVDALHDGVEIAVEIYDTAAEETRSQTPWVPVSVEHQGARPVVTQVGDAHDPLLPGDEIEFAAGGRELAEGETLEWTFPAYGGYFAFMFWPATYPEADNSRIRLTSPENPATTGPYDFPLVVSVVKDGVRIARSEFTSINLGHRELNVSGHRNLYREGGRVDLDASVYPVRESDELTYTWTFSKDGEAEVWGEEQQDSPALVGPELTKAEHHGGRLRLSLYNQGRLAQQSSSMPVNVTDDQTTQILEFNSLADHYHQGNQINLSLTVDPEPLEGDTLEWQWRWPGTEWTAMPGVEDNRWRVTAEQALDGLEIRAVLTYADPAREPDISETRTVHVDDHGAAARQKPSVGGETDHVAGEQVTLTRELPANGQTILTRHRWERRAAGAEGWTVLAGETGAQLTFPAKTSDDGAQYRVALLKPNGDVAYGPSEPVTLTVRPAVVEEPPPPGGDTPPPPTPTPPAGPAPGPDVAQPVAPQVERIAARRKVGGRRVVALARVACLAGGPTCRVNTPRRVTVRIAGRRFKALVRAPRTIRPGGRAKVSIRLPREAARRLKRHRKGTVAFRIRITAGELRTSTRVSVRLRR